MDRKCLFPKIWLNEETNKCVANCPENTCRHYDENGVYKCLEKCAQTSLRKLGNIIKGRHSGEYYGETSIEEEQMRYGSGLMLYQNVDVYFGNWDNDERSGKGVLLEANGDIYDGDWQNDKRNGTGSFIDINGEKYEGEWLDDMKHGYGVFQYENQTKYSGEWQNDVQHSRGVVLYPNGTMLEGNWINGIFIG